MKTLCSFALFLGLATQCIHADFTGTVDAVPDGDTLWVAKSDGQRIKIRLVFCDAPEIAQPHGIQARDYLRAQCLNKEVTVREEGTDDYGRVLGEITLDGVSINKEIIKEGHGWWFYHYHPEVELGELEISARSAKKGLFAADAPIYPRAWRHGARLDDDGQDSDDSDNGSGGAVSASLFIMALLPNPTGDDVNKETVILANSTDAVISVDQWKIEDDDGGVFVLSGTVPSGGARNVRLNASLQLGNGGDTVQLKNEAGEVMQTLTYGNAPSGKFITAK